MTTEERHQLEVDVARGAQVGAFLENEHVQAVFQSLEISYFAAFKAASTPAERESVHAQASAFDALRETLQAVVASGERATHELALAQSSNADLV